MLGRIISSMLHNKLGGDFCYKRLAISARQVSARGGGNYPAAGSGAFSKIRSDGDGEQRERMASARSGAMGTGESSGKRGFCEIGSSGRRGFRDDEESSRVLPHCYAPYIYVLTTFFSYL